MYSPALAMTGCLCPSTPQKDIALVGQPFLPPHSRYVPFEHSLWLCSLPMLTPSKGSLY